MENPSRSVKTRSQPSITNSKARNIRECFESSCRVIARSTIGVTYAFPHATVSLYSAPIIVTFVDGCFADYARKTQGVAASFRLYATADTGLFRKLSVWAQFSEVTCIDAELDLVRVQKIDDSEAVIFCLVDKVRRDVLAVSSQDEITLSVSTMRLLRILVHTQFLEAGMTSIHAGALVKNGRGIAISGAKFAGKSTTIINGIIRGDFGFMSNDIVFLNDMNDKIEIIGLPFAAGLRWGTVALSSTLVELAKERSTFEVKGISGDPTENEGRLYLRPAEISSLFGCALEARADLACVIVPEYSPRAASLELHALTSAELENALMRQYLTDAPYKFLPYWRNLARVNRSEEIVSAHHTIASVVRRTPGYHMIQNERTNDAACSELDRLVRLRS